jgi:tripartite-type tricarboxylate transporter receptor subunit TctC
MRLLVGRMLCAMLAFACWSPAHAQKYPERPVRLIVVFPPGGAVDIVGRLLGQKLGESLGQQFVIDNRAGGGQIIGTELAAKAPADGYTLVLASVTHAINPALHPKLPYDSVADFAPITLVAESPLVIFVRPGLGINSVKDLIASAKAKPGSINYGSSGSGSGGHLAVELLKYVSGIDVVHIPYKGAGPALTALLAGEVQLMCTSPLAGRPYVQAGRLLALAVTGRRRYQAMPELPTVAEAAGLPGFEVTLWYPLMAPAATPPAIINKLYVESIKALKSPDIVAQLAAQGVEVVGSTPQELAAYMKSETAKWSRLIRDAKIKAN